MSKGKLVRIAPDVMEKLGKAAKSFESPNECIKRLLETSCNQGSTSESNNNVKTESQ